ncbi:unnamed protein product [Chilo suppressalis]|uniref:Uncharacterized protein n=1 Tax=Chilo suppressalis TaxID=168631 RepID=A0ABN8ARW8_CHISP|nr:unnamed protein product [Chilo suppressalis]
MYEAYPENCLWLNILRCFRKFPDLYYTKPSQNPSDIGNFPRDYYLSTSLKLHMGGKRFSTDEEVKQEVEKWTKVLARNNFEEGIKKLIPRFTTCVEK